MTEKNENKEVKFMSTIFVAVVVIAVVAVAGIYVVKKRS